MLPCLTGTVVAGPAAALRTGLAGALLDHSAARPRPARGPPGEPLLRICAQRLLSDSPSQLARGPPRSRRATRFAAQHCGSSAEPPAAPASGGTSDLPCAGEGELAKQAPPRRKTQLRPRIQKVGVVLDPGHHGSEGIPFCLEEVELSGGARLVLHARLLGCVDRGIAPRPSRQALRDIRSHRLPVPVNRIVRVEPSPLLTRPGRLGGGAVAADVR